MPAKYLLRASTEGAYAHVYNKGVENRLIFNDTQDYGKFLEYLREYLTSPSDLESAKKTFVVNGKTFRGLPHMPKNYLNKVELIAYSLYPDHFHLIVQQLEKGSMAGFIRSLCTRYSMYYNKKYNRKGSLFDGPYKSIQIDKVDKIPYLSRFIFNHSEEKNDSISLYCSFAECIGERQSIWVKTGVVTEKIDNFREFVKNHNTHDNLDKLEGLIFSEGLERSTTANSINTYAEPPLVAKESPSRSKTLAFAMSAMGIFVILFTLGARNISTTGAQIVSATPSATPIAILIETPEPQVLGTTPTPSPSPTPEAKYRAKVMIMSQQDTETVDIHLEPALESEIIGRAMSGDVFQLGDSQDPEWYRVMLEDGTAYVLTKDAVLIEREI